VNLKDKKVTRGWRNLHYEGLHNLHSSINTVTVITSRMMLWAGCVVLIKETLFLCLFMCSLGLFILIL